MHYGLYPPLAPEFVVMRAQVAEERLVANFCKQRILEADEFPLRSSWRPSLYNLNPDYIHDIEQAEDFKMRASALLYCAEEIIKIPLCAIAYLTTCLFFKHFNAPYKDGLQAHVNSLLTCLKCVYSPKMALFSLFNERGRLSAGRQVEPLCLGEDGQFVASDDVTWGTTYDPDPLSPPVPLLDKLQLIGNLETPSPPRTPTVEYCDIPEYPSDSL